MHVQSESNAYAGYPLITIGIPTRNRASLVKNCVAAALAQSYQNIEVLVSDNASTDDTVAILNSMDDRRLRVLTSHVDIGRVENFKKCVCEAMGDYLVLVSDDNILDPEFLEKCVQLVRREPGIPIVLAAYDIVVIDEFSPNARRLVPAVLSKKLSTGIWDGTVVLTEYLQGKISAQTLSSIIRTDILRRNGGYTNEHPYACDEAVWIPALFEGQAGLVNERCATYYAHGSSVSSTLAPDTRLKDLCVVMRKISHMAEQKISDYATRRQIQKLTWRYVAYQAIVTLVLYRRSGASLIDVLVQLWNWRTLLKPCTAMDFLATLRLRSLARIVLPIPVLRLTIALRLDRIF